MWDRINGFSGRRPLPRSVHPSTMFRMNGWGSRRFGIGGNGLAALPGIKKAGNHPKIGGFSAISGFPRGNFRQPQIGILSIFQIRPFTPCHIVKNSAYSLPLDLLPGGFSGVAPPVPIPNTVVKRPSADDTALATKWENRSPPGSISTPPAAPARFIPASKGSQRHWAGGGSPQTPAALTTHLTTIRPPGGAIPLPQTLGNPPGSAFDTVKPDAL